MRTNETFNKRILPKIQKALTPRIRDDIMTFKAPDLKNTPLYSQYIYGKKGCGKTIYATHLMIEHTRRAYLGDSGEGFGFINMVEFIYQLRQSIGGERDADKRMIANCCECDFIVLDDFGTVKPTDWVMEVLYLIINTRYEFKRTTVFTSNLTLKELGDLLQDHRLVSRIERMCEEIVEKKHWKNG